MTLLTTMNAREKTFFPSKKEEERRTSPARIYCKIVKEIKETTGS